MDFMVSFLILSHFHLDWSVTWAELQPELDLVLNFAVVLLTPVNLGVYGWVVNGSVEMALCVFRVTSFLSFKTLCFYLGLIWN